MPCGGSIFLRATRAKGARPGQALSPTLSPMHRAGSRRTAALHRAGARRRHLRLIAVDHPLHGQSCALRTVPEKATTASPCSTVPRTKAMRPNPAQAHPCAPPSAVRRTSDDSSAAAGGITGFDGGLEGAQQAILRFDRRGVTRLAAVDMRAGPRHQLAAGVFADIERRGDIGVGLLEDVVQQIGGALLRRQPLQHQEKRRGQRAGELTSSAGTAVWIGSGSHGPT